MLSSKGKIRSNCRGKKLFPKFISQASFLCLNTEVFFVTQTGKFFPGSELWTHRFLFLEWSSLIRNGSTTFLLLMAPLPTPPIYTCVGPGVWGAPPEILWSLNPGTIFCSLPHSQCLRAGSKSSRNICWANNGPLTCLSILPQSIYERAIISSIILLCLWKWRLKCLGEPLQGSVQCWQHRQLLPPTAGNSEWGKTHSFLSVTYQSP